ncbi:hypothetical protein BGZ63DRAFT_81596 [Mariannaea sp. PMI_226]|nr:hypothetical protein BGZ63DRAFT_81596 [Mariannaea sp. PMI_226]
MKEPTSTSRSSSMTARRALITNSSRICRRFMNILLSEEPYDPQIQSAITALRGIESALLVLRLYDYEYSNPDQWDPTHEVALNSILSDDFSSLEGLCNDIDEFDTRGTRWNLSQHQDYIELFESLKNLQEQLDTLTDQITSFGPTSSHF